MEGQGSRPAGRKVQGGQLLALGCLTEGSEANLTTFQLCQELGSENASIVHDVLLQLFLTEV